MFPSYGMFQQGALPTLEKAVAFAEFRQRVIANNIANVETPGYQAKDVPVQRFQNRLKEAIYNRRFGNPRVFDFRDDRVLYDSRGFLKVQPTENKFGLMRHSKNNVDIDMENAKMASNGLYHGGLARILSQQLSQLQSAIRGSF